MGSCAYAPTMMGAYGPTNRRSHPNVAQMRTHPCCAHVFLLPFLIIQACCPRTQASPLSPTPTPLPTPPPLPTPSLPPKKRPILTTSLVSPPAAWKDTSKMTMKPVYRCSQRIAARGGTSTSAPKEKVVIAIRSYSEPKPNKLEDAIHEVVEMDEDHEEDPEEDPEEAPKDPEVEEDPEEDLKESEEGVEEHFGGEDDYANYWQLEDSESENVLRDDLCYWNYDDLSDWQNAEPSESSAWSCIGPPLANPRHMIAPQ
ncbi:hypothetical protein PIB30_094198 [Stylosanthes scabra]|uniref:Uncharacterized protein n=1 Tax=Stylosanthes scabra TaxID=79078 RepID=A0ABU6SXT2_9FABA|nr:hypothetical protein [Stylosanthes scabra]